MAGTNRAASCHAGSVAWFQAEPNSPATDLGGESGLLHYKRTSQNSQSDKAWLKRRKDQGWGKTQEVGAEIWHVQIWRLLKDACKPQLESALLSRALGDYGVGLPWRSKPMGNQVKRVRCTLSRERLLTRERGPRGGYQPPSSLHSETLPENWLTKRRSWRKQQPQILPQARGSQTGSLSYNHLLGKGGQMLPASSCCHSPG